MRLGAAEDFRELGLLLSQSSFSDYSLASRFGKSSVEEVLSDVVRCSLFDSQRSRRGTVDSLIDLFVRNSPVAASAAGDFPPPLLERLLDMQLVSWRGSELLPLVSISPYADNWFVSDQLFRLEAAPEYISYPACEVMPPHASSFLVLEYIRRWCHRSGTDVIVDVGTGSGFLAIVCAQLGLTAVGWDISDRIVDVARANGNLNRSSAQFFQPSWPLERAELGGHGLVAFNSPAGIDLNDEGSCAEEMSVPEAFSIAVAAGRMAGFTSFDVLVFGVASYDCPCPGVEALRVEGLDVVAAVNPVRDDRFKIGADHIATGQPPPESLMFGAHEEFDAVCEYARSHGIKSVWPVLVTASDVRMR